MQNYDILYINEFDVLVQVLPLQVSSTVFPVWSNNTQQYIITFFLKEPKD